MIISFTSGATASMVAKNGTKKFSTTVDKIIGDVWVCMYIYVAISASWRGRYRVRRFNSEFWPTLEYNAVGLECGDISLAPGVKEDGRGYL